MYACEPIFEAVRVPNLNDVATILGPQSHTGSVTATFSNPVTKAFAHPTAFFTAGSDGDASWLAALSQTSVTQTTSSLAASSSLQDGNHLVALASSHRYFRNAPVHSLLPGFTFNSDLRPGIRKDVAPQGCTAPYRARSAIPHPWELQKPEV